MDKDSLQMSSRNTAPADARCRVAILCSGDREASQNPLAANSRFSKVFQALAALGVHAQPAIYHDDFCDDVRRQIMQVDAVLVWVNPRWQDHRPGVPAALAGRHGPLLLGA